MPTEGGNEKASEFLLRMAVHPDLRSADKKKMREVAYLFISIGEQLTRLYEENERLIKYINNLSAANEEIPF